MYLVPCCHVMMKGSSMIVFSSQSSSLLISETLVH